MPVVAPGTITVVKGGPAKGCPPGDLEFTLEKGVIFRNAQIGSCNKRVCNIVASIS